MIGINQQIQTRSGGGEGVGFAVPIDVVKRSLGAAARGRARPHYAYLGVSSVPLYPQLVEHFDLTSTRARGCRRSSPGGPADRGRPARRQRAARPSRASAFARGGDVITKVGGKPIDDADDLSAAIARFKPGQEVDVEIHRGGETQDDQGQARRAAAG